MAVSVAQLSVHVKLRHYATTYYRIRQQDCRPAGIATSMYFRQLPVSIGIHMACALFFVFNTTNYLHTPRRLQFFHCNAEFQFRSVIYVLECKHCHNVNSPPILFLKGSLSGSFKTAALEYVKCRKYHRHCEINYII